MKVKASKKAGAIRLELDPASEPRLVEAFFDSLQKLPNIRFKKILATTDFSELSLKGVDYALAVSRNFGAGLVLVHAVEPSVYLGGLEAVVIGRSDEQFIKLEKRHLAMLASRLSKKGQPIRPITRYGKAFREITQLAAELNSDLIVTTTHGYTGLKRALIGGTAEWVVRYAPCPVLTVPAETAEHQSGRNWASYIRRILVPIDFSEASTRALPYAAALAEKFKAVVTLVHVTEILPISGFDYIPAATFQAQASRSGEELLLRAQREAFPDTIETQTAVLTGSPFHEITRAAQRSEADLIVLTTHGRTGLKHALLGSTAERVVRHAPCPVLVVRDKTAK